ncbi:MAG: hypothetical protein NW206_12810 [Hyphomonadaceae bacterium]|nr:hypothetical protein [Hyphomonadaceae bacterium]
MKLVSAALLAFGLVALAACGGNRSARTIELPGGGPSEPVANEQAPPNFFERMLGQDDRPNVGPCPLMGVLYEGSRKVEFANPGEERYANIAYTGEMRGVRGLCRYVDADPITMEMTIDMAFGRGPAATSNEHTYRYWVAVTRRGRAPIEKQYFDVNVRFPDDQAVVTHTEEIERIVIPRANPDTSGENFEVLVGFDLTPEQIAFNRAGKRFRVDAPSQAANQ